MRMERDYKSLPEDHKKRLKFSIEEKIEKIKTAIDQNYNLLMNIASPYSSMFKFYMNVKINFLKKKIINRKKKNQQFSLKWSYREI